MIMVYFISSKNKIKKKDVKFLFFYLIETFLIIDKCLIWKFCDKLEHDLRFCCINQDTYV